MVKRHPQPLAAIIVTLAFLLVSCSSDSSPAPAAIISVSAAEAGWWLTETIHPGQVTDNTEPETETPGVIRIEADVFFEIDSSVIRVEEADHLKDVADRIVANGQPVVIVGHTDDSGEITYNHQLGHDRAASVRSHLINELNVPADLIFGIDSQGETCPIQPNTTPSNRAENRRVDVFEPAKEPGCWPDVER